MNSQHQSPPHRRSHNNNRPKSSLIGSRKRSHSSASSSSPESANNVFSTASSSDSGSSSMISTIRTQPKKKRTYPNTKITTKHDNDSSSSADSSTSSLMTTPQPPATTPTSFSSSLPPKLTAQRSVPAFLNKLYNMVEDLSTTDLIRWSKDGNSFVVERHEEFAKTVLPRFYKHNTFASFVRQLNMYDFHKVPHLQQGVLIAESEHEIWEFSNPHFQRGRPDLLVLVTRKRNRDKDAIDTENISLASLVSDLSNVKKQQSTIGTDLRELHRDNEILWQETLNAREKYQRHQEAIEKIIQFLTTIFSNERLALSMNNPDILPKGLIDEAASLAGMSTASKLGSLDNNSNNKTALSSVLSSVLRLYSTQPPTSPMSDARPITGQQHTTHSRNSFFQSSTPRSPTEENLENESLLNSFSRTLNTATRSARTISEGIDVLQMNIESLAQNLGLDPSQFNDDLDGLRSRFQEHYSDMIDAANQDDRSELFDLVADGNSRVNNSSMFMHPKEDVANISPRSATIPMSTRLQQQQQPSAYQTHPLSPSLVQPMQQQEVQNNKKFISRQSNLPRSTSVYQKPSQPSAQSTTYPMMGKNEKNATETNTHGGDYRTPYLLSMNYPDPFGSNYSNNGGKAEREYPASQRGGTTAFNPPQVNNNTRKGYINCYQNTNNKDTIQDQTTLMMPVQVPIDVTHQPNYAQLPTQVAYNELAQQQNYSQFDDDHNNFS
ncbi:hypothetical protein K501DRAFT_335237 [Backusella circina FSU 941]|nr:hypothetical protein K501DRAFT_335237 [Backusella circina FSU 941]